MKKKVYIVSHSHLDREWYMPYEQHHMRVVELFDELIDSFENDPSFKYFHLDGQTIPLDDYLEVKPQNEPLIRKYIKEGRLCIGPFFILQDDFLISSEANTRNTLIGLQEVEKYGGKPVKLGYFPDTFGNMGQTPQMMKLSGIDAAAFGRGVKPTGLNNVVSDSYSSQFSEMNWQGPDESTIFGLLFANWYSNGNEIPTTKEEAISYWEKKLEEVEKYASTNHLLMMNGVDHQPLQKDVGQAIDLANELFPDYEFKHSHFNEYLEAVQKDLPNDLATVRGELTSQETSGWYTLANTASSRVYLKQENIKTQTLLENVAEPLVVLANETTGYNPSDELRYAWKYLLQNHPHDSICGCSVDEVHQEMMIRYKKAQEVAKFVRDEATRRISEEINTSKFAKNTFPFVVFNTAGTQKTSKQEVKIEIDRIPFSAKWPGVGFDELVKRKTPEFSVIDENGMEIPSVIKEIKVEFGYDLPKDGFRIPYMAKYAYVDVLIENLPMMSYQTFALSPKKSTIHPKNLVNTENILENEFLKAQIMSDGSLTLTNKKTGKVYEKQLVFENVGDIGNEYIFKQSADNLTLYSTQFPFKVEMIEDNALNTIVELTNYMEIPVSADETLELEQQRVTDITNRKAKRSNQTKTLVLKTQIQLTKNSKSLTFKTIFMNEMKNHRLRVLFDTNIISKEHYAQSIFEVVKRPNKVSKYWENPTNPQHQHEFVNIHDEENGLTVGNIGLNEYEILEGNTIALTLLRATGEMGDWGYFPTPEAQCLGEQVVEYTLQAHNKESYYESLQQAVAFKIPFTTVQTKVQNGTLKSHSSFVTSNSDVLMITALKVSEDKKGMILRGFSLDNEETHDLNLNVFDKKAKLVNLLEESIGEFTGKLTKAQILTTFWG
ncbi:MAG: alpha-mannosidase [Streptococcaceae bacterium]|nr:alpha-mannosidase [Streptococcaceae bacterium]